MLALLQRVSEASVSVSGERIASIDRGVLALVAVEPKDGEAEVDRMADRLLKFRIFADSKGRMNLDIGAVNGGLLLVPQFTLAADTASGHRPSFSTCAPPEKAEALFDALCLRIRELGQRVESGRFGADMQVALVNDGPVTFPIQVNASRS